MRLITWNCRVGAFRRKSAQVAALAPDVLVVPECEDVRRLPLLDGATQPSARHWCESMITPRGVGVFSYTGATITPAPLIGEPLDFFVPFEVTATERSFRLAAVWTAVTKSKATSYRQVHEGLDRYEAWIAARDTVILGDFNLNASYEKGKPWADMMGRMKRLRLVSAYHAFFREEFGEETRPTHFYKGKESSPWHLDYCFIPEGWVPHLRNVTVGTYGDWSTLSDHVPVTVDIDW